jgi:UDP-GlcNAc:undecaprenyl-phosphate GlcNAc-1-phosphate transferase
MERQIINLILCFVSLQGVVTLLARKLFLHHGLVDKPGDRKRHISPIPFCGGIALYVSLTALTVVLQPLNLLLVAYLPLLFIFIISLIDDIKHISSHARLLSQAVTVLLFIALLQGFQPMGWLSLVPTPLLSLEIVGLVVLVFCGCGIINAFNMSDGIDGLCAGLSILANAAFGYLFYLNGLQRWVLFCLITIALLAVFLCFNLSRRWKIFLGDSGSALLGYLSFATLVILTIKLKILGVGTAIWFIACPLMGMGRVILLRLLKRCSPFQADRQHVHYMLLDGGMHKYRVLGLILGCQIAFSMIGLYFFFHSVPAVTSIIVFLTTFTTFFVVMHPSNQHRVSSFRSKLT